MSFHEADSDLGKLRRAPAGSVVKLDPATVFVLTEALRLHRESGGLFDVTVGRQLVEAGFLPLCETHNADSFRGTCADITIVDDQRVTLGAKMLIDLGGIAKGYATDSAIGYLQRAGAPMGLVNAGGDLRLFGERQWPVHLRDGDGEMRETILAQDCALASSANALERRQIGTREWSPHIGADGQPVLTQGRVTVIADSCMLADAMTKIALVDRTLAAQMLGARGTVLPPLPPLPSQTQAAA